MSVLTKFRNSFLLFRLSHLMDKLDSTFELGRKTPPDRAKCIKLVRQIFKCLQGQTFLKQECPSYPTECCFHLLHFCFNLNIYDGPLIRDIMLYFIQYSEGTEDMFGFIKGICYPQEIVDSKMSYILEMSEKGRLQYKGQRMSDFLLFQFVLTSFSNLSNSRLRLLLRHGTRELMSPCVLDSEDTDGHDFVSSYTLLELLRYLLWNLNHLQSSRYHNYDVECIRFIRRALWFVPKHVTRGLVLLDEFRDIDEVPSLKHLCRCSVRRSLYVNWQLPSGLSKLPISQNTLLYLKLKRD